MSEAGGVDKCLIRFCCKESALYLISQPLLPFLEGCLACGCHGYTVHSEDLSVSWLSQRLTRAAGHRTLCFLVHLTGSLVCVYHTRLLNKPKQRDIHGPTASQGSLTHSASLADFSHDVLERLWVAVGVLTHSLWLWWDELQDAASWLSMCVPEFGICGHVSFTRSRAPLSKHRIKWST